MTRRRRSPHRRRGFTLIEVMVSLGVMTIGAMAIISLQAHAIRANSHARQLTTATQIAQRWIERLKQDAHTWNQIATPGDVATVLGNTQFLRQVTSNANVYQYFPNGSATRSSAFDYQGNDVLPTSADPVPFYCAAFRPAWVYFGRAMRVDVRVWWPRAGSGHTLADDWGNCTNTNHDRINPGGELFDDYHVVYLSTVIRMTPVTR